MENKDLVKMDGNFKKLLSLNLNSKTDTKGTGRNALKYLSWSEAWGEFVKVYPGAIYEILNAWSGNFYCTNGISVSVCRNNRCKWRCFFRICKQIISDSFVSNGAGSVV